VAHARTLEVEGTALVADNRRRTSVGAPVEIRVLALHHKALAGKRVEVDGEEQGVDELLIGGCGRRCEDEGDCENDGVQEYSEWSADETSPMCTRGVLVAQFS